MDTLNAAALVTDEHVEADHNRLGVRGAEAPLESGLSMMRVDAADKREHIARELGLYSSDRGTDFVVAGNIDHRVGVGRGFGPVIGE